MTSRDSAAGEGRRRQTAVNRFAQYLPRSEVRKENRLAAWYAKYGYSGPPYCKACAESFNSHLLKQAVRSIARGASWHQAAGGRHPLTQLLKPCFTHPAAHTLVLATVSPAAKDTEHT